MENTYKRPRREERDFCEGSQRKTVGNKMRDKKSDVRKKSTRELKDKYKFSLRDFRLICVLYINILGFNLCWGYK